MLFHSVSRCFIAVSFCLKMFHCCFMLLQGVSLLCFMLFQGVSLLCFILFQGGFTALFHVASRGFTALFHDVSRCFKVFHCPVSSCFMTMKQMQWERTFKLFDHTHALSLARLPVRPAHVKDVTKFKGCFLIGWEFCSGRRLLFRRYCPRDFVQGAVWPHSKVIDSNF